MIRGEFWVGIWWFGFGFSLVFVYLWVFERGLEFVRGFGFIFRVDFVLGYVSFRGVGYFGIFFVRRILVRREVW